LDGLSPLFFLDCLLLLLLLDLGGTATLFAIGFFFKAASGTILDGILQNYFPKFLITLSDKVGGSAEQQRHALLRQASFL
jgi:hypothetical protein